MPYGSYLFADTFVYGTAEGLNASPGLATGTVTVLDGGKQVGTPPITSGNFASFPAISAGVYPYAVGTHKLTATYPGTPATRATPAMRWSLPCEGCDFSGCNPDDGDTRIHRERLRAGGYHDRKSGGRPPTGTITLTANGKTTGVKLKLHDGERVW